MTFDPSHSFQSIINNKILHPIIMEWWVCSIHFGTQSHEVHLVNLYFNCLEALLVSGLLIFNSVHIFLESVLLGISSTCTYSTYHEVRSMLLYIIQLLLLTCTPCPPPPVEWSRPPWRWRCSATLTRWAVQPTARSWEPFVRGWRNIRWRVCSGITATPTAGWGTSPTLASVGGESKREWGDCVGISCFAVQSLYIQEGSGEGYFANSWCVCPVCVILRV